MPSQQLRDLRHYQRSLRNCSEKIICAICKKSIFAKDYEKHCTIKHDLNAKIYCVWCIGKKFWIRGEKNKFALHLIECRQTFMNQNRLYQPTDTFTPFEIKPMCKPKVFFSRHKLKNIPNRAYKILWPMPLDPMRLFFQDDNLNLAVACVRKYLELKNETDWFHVMVRPIAFSSFLQALDADNGKTRTLPFSCWCDGGKHEDPMYRQHRHMIVVSSPKGHFIENVWKKVQIDARPFKNFPCKRLKPIVSNMHLVNVLGYVSKRNSKCNFSFKKRSKNESLNHFYIFTPLSEDYRIALVVQWDGGLLELVNQNFRRMSSEKLAQAPVTNAYGRWQIKIKDIPNITLDLVLPVSNEFIPCPQKTNYFLHLIGDRKLYFCKKMEPKWNPKEQVKMGNRFYGVVGENDWYPSPAQQKCLNTAKIPMHKLQQEKEKLEDENKHLKWGKERLEDENKQLKCGKESLEEKIKQHENRIYVLEKEIKQLKDRISVLEEEKRQVKKIELTIYS